MLFLVRYEIMQIYHKYLELEAQKTDASCCITYLMAIDIFFLREPLLAFKLFRTFALGLSKTQHAAVGF